jgi:hypothetical protein
MMGNRAGLRDYDGTDGGLIVNNAIGLTDNGASPDSIDWAAGGFTAAGFDSGAAGGNITVIGANTSANDGTYEIVSVVDTKIEIPTGSFASTDAAAASYVGVCETSGGSWADIFRHGVAHIYSGTMPTDPDAAISGTQLLIISESGGAFVSGDPTNGINFDVAASGAVSKDTAQTWQDVGLATGVAAWGVFYPNTVDATASSTAIRALFDVATSGAVMTMANTTVTSGATTTVDTCSFTLPAV